MKKWLNVVLSVIFLLGILVGCTGKQGETQKANLANNNQQETGGKEVNISYFTWRTSDQYPANLFKEFNKKYPNIHVTTNGNHNVDQYLQAQKVRLISGDSIDITGVTPQSYLEYVKAGYLMDLTDQPFMKNFSPSSLSKLKVDGKLYAVPTAINYIGVWYNQDLFAKYNLNIPKTWDEFLQVCEKLKANGVVPLVNGGKDGWPMEFDIYPFIHKLVVDDPQIFEKVDKGEIKYTDPIFVNTFKAITDFYKKGYIHKDLVSLTGDQATDLFVQQKVGMVIQGDWFAEGASKRKIDFKVGVFPMPTPGEGDKVIVPVSVGSYDAIVNSSKNKDSALKVMEYMSSPEGAKFMVDSLKSFSPVQGVNVDPSSLLKLWEPMQKYDAVEFFYSLQYPGANSELLKGLQDLYLGGITPEQLAKNIQAAQDKKAAK
jgi:raffinose/stachyose/melibiose transport system substrate-binding protein